MRPGTEGASVLVVRLRVGTGTPAGSGDGRRLLGVKWVVCERIQVDRRTDGDFWVQHWHGSAQGLG